MKKGIILTFTSLLLYCTPSLLANNNTTEKSAILSSIEESYSQTPPIVYNDFRITIGGGYSYRLGKSWEGGDDNFKDFEKKLRNGYNIALEMQYFPTKNFGWGLNFNYSRFRAYGENIYSQATCEEINKHIHVSPAFIVRKDTKNFLLTSSVGFGPTFFTNIINGTKGTKLIIVPNIGIGSEYKLSQSMGAGLKLSCVLGKVKSLYYDNDTKRDTDISISALSLTGFLSFKW